MGDPSGVRDSWGRCCLWRNQHPQHSWQVLELFNDIFCHLLFYNPVFIFSKMGNRRTANVRSVGYSDLFSLSKVNQLMWQQLFVKKTFFLARYEKNSDMASLFYIRPQPQQHSRSFCPAETGRSAIV